MSVDYLWVAESNALGGGSKVNGVMVVGVVLVATIGLFVVWCGVMNRIEQREQRRYAEEARRDEGSGTGDARHLRSGGRRR